MGRGKCTWGIYSDGSFPAGPLQVAVSLIGKLLTGWLSPSKPGCTTLSPPLWTKGWSQLCLRHYPL